MKLIRSLFHHPYSFLGLLGLACLPLIFCLTSFFSKNEQLNALENAMTQLRLKEARLKKRGESEDAFLAKMQQADHRYIDKHLETLVFLEPEIQQLELQTDSFFKKRLEFLKGNGNRLLFAEEEIRKGDLFQEVEERLQHSVEMNEEDLKRTLTLIENIPIPPFSIEPNAPQLIIKNFELVKKSTPSNQEVYTIQFQLIKREGNK